jgi:hypothetical protein
MILIKFIEKTVQKKKPTFCNWGGQEPSQYLENGAQQHVQIATKYVPLSHIHDQIGQITSSACTMKCIF